MAIDNTFVHVQRTVRCTSWHRSGTLLAVASFDGTTTVWSLVDEEWECVSTLEGHENEVKCVAWSPVSDYLATCGRDKTVWIWEMMDAYEFDCVSVLNGHTQDVKMVAWHPSGEMLISASYDDSIKLWMEDPDEDDWHCVKTLSGEGQGHTSTVWGVALDSAGQLLASCSDDQSLIVWERTEEAGDVSQGWSAACSISGYHTRAVFSVQFSPDGRYLASAGGDDSLRIFTQEDAEMASAGGPASRSYAQVVANEKAHTADINCVQWNPTQIDGKWVLATAGDDKKVKIWEFESNGSS